MDLHKILTWSGGILAFLLYYPILSRIFRGELEQSFATWILWVALDSIALVSIIFQGGNFILLVSYVIGGSTVTCALVYTRQFKWGGFETFVLSLVTICLIIWYIS